MRRVAVAGVTGSIGRQTLDVLRDFNDEFSIVAISAYSRVDDLIAIAHEFNPQLVVVANESDAKRVRDALPKCDVQSGESGLEALANSADIVVNAIVGFAGLRVTLHALYAGSRVALANKESLVAGGELVASALLTKGAELIPVDSEHSAIFQCLQAGKKNEVRELVLTSSGGPFRTFTHDQLKSVTIEQALAHPKWNMGSKISIDSSTMMNKALEIMEAHELFGVSCQDIRVVVHPQAIVHSAVTFVDGSTIAQMSQPDMRLPISYALHYPHRSTRAQGALDWTSIGELQFEEPNRDVFVALDLAVNAVTMGGSAPTVLNAANEVAVESFLQAQIPWLAITDVVSETMATISTTKPLVVEELEVADQEARQCADGIVRRISS